MGNRAVITIKEKNVSKENWNSLYLHWNGGRDSVEPFLHVAKLYGIRCASDPKHAIARLGQLIGNYFGGTLSLGVGRYGSLDTDNYDNGVYIIDGFWDIVGREYMQGPEQQEYEFDEFVKDVREVNDCIFGYTDDKTDPAHGVTDGKVA
tara:strand:+ start:549 stop:995 length:447 start_codon:yes stop_codon:yes gene_type:complete